MNSATTLQPDFREEIQRIARISDMLCTGHAWLKDRYRRRALALDLLILLASTWLASVAFVSPETARRLTPANIDPMLWIGILGVFTFALSIVQLKVDWKGNADAHQRSFDIYAEVKRLAHYLLRAEGLIPKNECHEVLLKYDLASQFGTGIPEKDFLKAKKRHKIKVEISKHLDTHPGASIWLYRLRIWLRDNRKR